MELIAEVVLRAMERLLAVAAGGMSVYLGYRLFIKIPEQRDSHGKITLPWDITVVLSRVGPGVFFALFGAAVVAYSLRAAVTLTRSSATGAGETRAESEAYSGIDQSSGPGAGALQARRLEARPEMEFLNGLPALLKSALTDEEKRTVAARVTALKLGLMAQLWGPDWGGLEAFKAWAEDGAQDPVPKRLEAAAAYYRAGQQGAR